MFNIFKKLKDGSNSHQGLKQKVEMHDPFKFPLESTVTKVMIVEPNKDVRDMLTNILQRKGSEVIAVENATQALAGLNNNYIDIIISDINLPVINGVDFCSIVKNKFKNIYFIMLTAKDRVEDIVNSFNTGANECISKPFNFVDVIAKIQSAENIINTHKKLTFLSERLEKCVNTDHLTELKTRRFFNHEASKEMRRSKRYKHNAAVLMLDVDNFKSINDTYGHIAGDKVLKAIASKLVTSTRESDLVCRYGGEEFILLFPEIGHKNAYIAAEKVRKNISNMTVEIDGVNISPTVSIGVVIKTPDMDVTLEQVICMADKALYRAKNSGRNKTVLYND